MTIRDFWRATSGLPKAGLVLAAVAAAVNAGTYFGLSMHGADSPLAMLHLATIVLMAILFVRIGLHHRLAFRAPRVQPDRHVLPRSVAWLAACALIYLLVTFLLPFTQHSEGAAEVRNGQDVWVVRDSVVQILTPGSAAAFDSAMLRAFSAVWLFFGLVIALAGHTVEARIRDYRSALRQASA